MAEDKEDELDVVIEDAGEEPEQKTPPEGEGKKEDTQPAGKKDGDGEGGEDDRKPPKRRSFVDDPNIPEDVRRYIKAQRAKRGDAERALDERDRRIAELEAQLTQTGSAVVTANTQAADAMIAGAEAALRKAFEDGNAEEMVKAQKNLALAVSAKTEAERLKASQPKGDEGRTDTRQPEGRYSAESQEWIDQNPWFESDPAMRQSAIGFHHHIIRNGYLPDTPEYFAELDRRMRLSYPDFFEEDEPEPQKPAAKTGAKPAVAPVTRGNAANPGAISLKLTEAEREIARSMGMPELEYGVQRLLIEKKITPVQANQIRKKNGLPEVKV